MPSPHIQTLLKDFRDDLESFYQRLQLAPPYDSVEKALACFSHLVQTKTDDEQQQLAHDQIRKWKLYQRAVIESGLYKKHRGIISALLRSQHSTDTPEALRYLEEAFMNS